MSDVRFEQVSVAVAALERLLTEFRAIYKDGGALLGCFAVYEPGIPGWFTTLHTIQATEALQLFLTSAVVAIAFPELMIDKGLRLPEWNRLGPLAFGAELGGAVLHGSYTANFRGTYEEARAIGQDASDAIFGSRWQDVIIFGSHAGWSSWFCGILWNHTWIVADKGERRVWLLCTTDSD